MSNRLMTLAWQVPLPAPKKILLVALADRADESGKSWPSRAVLAHQTGLSDVTMWRHLSELVEAGLVTQQRRRQASSVYVVHEAAMVAAAHDTGPEAPSDAVPADPEAAEPAEAFHLEILQDETFQIETFHSGGQDLSQRNVPKGNPQEPSISSAIADRPDERRDDVERLCAALVEHRVRLGCKRPTVTAKWRTQARLLLDTDKRPLAEALDILDWSQHHTSRNGFSWASNIQSIPKFRDQYDTLRLQRANDPNATTTTSVRDPVALLREEWHAGRVTKIREFYLGDYSEPPPGDGDYRELLISHNRAWIERHRDAILARLTSEAS